MVHKIEIIEKKVTLADIQKIERENQKLMLEIDGQLKQKRSFIYTHYILPSFIAGFAGLAALAHIVKTYLEYVK